MQNKTLEPMVLLPVPCELLEEIGLEAEDMIQMSVSDGRIIIEKADCGGFVCDGECDDCPVNENECDDDCANCPCSAYCDDSDICPCCGASLN